MYLFLMWNLLHNIKHYYYKLLVYEKYIKYKISNKIKFILNFTIYMSAVQGKLKIQIGT